MFWCTRKFGEQARNQDFAWGGAYERRRRDNVGGLGVSSPRIFWKKAYLKQHFVHFEDSLLGKKEGKNEGTFLNSNFFLGTESWKT